MELVRTHRCCLCCCCCCCCFVVFAVVELLHWSSPGNCTAVLVSFAFACYPTGVLPLSRTISDGFILDSLLMVPRRFSSLLFFTLFFVYYEQKERLAQIRREAAKEDFEDMSMVRKCSRSSSAVRLFYCQKGLSSKVTESLARAWLTNLRAIETFVVLVELWHRFRWSVI